MALCGLAPPTAPLERAEEESKLALSGRHNVREFPDRGFGFFLAIRGVPTAAGHFNTVPSSETPPMLQTSKPLVDIAETSAMFAIALGSSGFERGPETNYEWRPESPRSASIPAYDYCGHDGL